jgi:hypothetical protein
MADLVTLEYATARLSGLTSGQVAALPSLITAASRAVESYCARSFTAVDRDEVVDVEDGLAELWPPILRLDSIMSDQAGALSIQATSELASVALIESGGGAPWEPITRTGLRLSRTASGTTTTSTVLFASNPTIYQLATAINALGGWSATIQNGLDAYPSSMLWVDGVGYAAEPNSAPLTVFVTPVWVVNVDRQAGLVVIDTPGRVRAFYRSGFETIPADVQEATIQAIRSVMSAADSAGVIEERLGDYSYKLASGAGSASGLVRPCPSAVALLARYRLLGLT